MIHVQSGDPLPLELVLADGNTGRFPRARVYNSSGVEVGGSPFNLTHVAGGFYRNTAFTPGADGSYTAIFTTYLDAGYTMIGARYGRAYEYFEVDDRTDQIDRLHTDYTTARAGNLDNLDALVSSREAETDAASRAATNQTEHDATQLAISGLNDLSESDVQSALDSQGYTAARAPNLDNLDALVSSRESESAAAGRASTNQTEHDTTQSAIAGLNDLSISDVQTAMDNQGYTAVRASNLDNLDAAVSSRATQASVNTIDAIVDAILVDTDTTIPGLIAALNNLSIADVQTALDNQGYSAARALLLDNLDAAISTRATQSSVDTIDSIVDAILVDTGTTIPALITALNNLSIADVQTAMDNQGYTSARAPNLDNLDAAVSSRQSESDAATRAAADIAEHDATQALIGTPASTVSDDIAAVKSDTADILDDTGNTGVLVASAEKDDIVDRVWDEPSAGHVAAGTVGEQQSRLDATITSRQSESDAASRAATNQVEHDATQSQISSLQSSVNTIDSIVDAILIDTGTTIPGLIAALNNLSASEAADAVWDELTAGHNVPGSFGEAINTLTPGGSIAEQVWDVLVANHSDPGTFGLLVDVIRQYVEDNNQELVDGSTGLAALKAETISQHALTRSEIDDNETKIDAIIPRIDTAETNLTSEVNDNEVKIDAIIPRIDTAETNLTTEIDQNEAKLDTIDGKVGAIQNNTTVRFIVPETLYRPDAGTKTYQFHLRLFDTDGNPEAPDSTPTIRIRSLTSGLDLVVGDPMTQDGVKVGAYYYDYGVASAATLTHLLVEATVVENGVTRYIPATTEIVEFQSDLAAIESIVTDTNTKVTTGNGLLTNPTFGLSAIKANQANIISEINANETKIDMVKAKTDTIPSDPATETSLTAISALIGALPDISDIQVRLDLQTDNLKGADDRDLTEVYDNFDTSDLAKTADPRFANLDATVSSRSTLTAGQVWSNATRTLTSISIPASEWEKVWKVLTSAISVPGSFGNLLKDMLDAPNSDAATTAEVTALLVGVAQEATLSGFISSTGINFAQVDSALSTIDSVVDAIKPKTDLIPASPAKETTLSAGIGDIQSDIADHKLVSDAIKAKTDNLPADPAEESSVQAIPTNPLLDNDSRVNNLDVAVSTRSTLDASDLSPLATSAELASTESDLTAKIDGVETKVDQVDLEVGQIKAKTDNLPSDPASDTRVDTAETNIRDDIASLPPPGGGATPADIWSFPSREITNDPNDFKADVSGLAEKTDIIPFYLNRMSVAFNDTTNVLTILAWAEKNGQRVIGSNATVTVKDDAGSSVWTATAATPNADGLFKFTQAVALLSDRNYYVEIDITVDSAVRKSHQPFFTTG